MSRGTFSRDQRARLASYMQQEQEQRRPPVQAGARAAFGEALPLGFSQQQLWFIDQVQRGSPAYILPQACRLSGPLNLDALHASFQHLCQRHESLRTTFVTRDGQPVQVIAPTLTLALPVEDLTALPPEQAEAAWQQRAQALVRQPFNLVDGPLLRVHLFRLQETEQVLVWCAHHIILDGWSLRLLTQELSQLYPALCQGQPSPLPAPRVQAADVACWQREWLQGEVLEAELAAWREQLAGAPQVLDLPTDHPRPAVQGLAGAQLTFALSPALSQQIAALSRQQGCTLFQTLLAGFQVLLSRWSGQQDLLVGTPVASRSQVDLESVVGCLVNTLVLRATLSGQMSFRQVVEQVRERSLEAFAHQEVPFEKVVEALQVPRDLSVSPLVQVHFAVQNLGAMALTLPDVRVQPVELSTGTSKVDLSLEFQLGAPGEGLQGTLQYRTELFEAATMERLVETLQTLLAALVANPDAVIASLPWVSPAEQQQLLAWNATARPFPPEQYPQSLPQVFEAQVARTPEAVALVDAQTGTSWSYAELNARANRLAWVLRAEGVGAETMVGICIERSLEMVVGVLAILKAGGCCVPLDPEYPPQRLAFLLQDAGVELVLTQPALRDRLAASPARLFCLEAQEERVASAPEHNLGVEIAAEQVASVVYTSGSTGVPKGVLLRHGGVCNRIWWGQAEHPLTASDAVLQEASLSFDFALWELFGTWAGGARVVLPRPGGQRDLDYLLAVIAEQQVTVLHLIPSLLRVLLEHPAVEQCCGQVRQVYGGAEALPWELWQRLAQRLPEVQLHNVYGPTEASLDSTCWTCEREGSRMLVGTPIANVQVYLLDQGLHLVPIGVAAEVYIGGAGLARGYWQRPELTAERFVPNPFSQEPGARLYRTGDVARYRADGKLEYVGRVDQQVKVRGFRIELGEIEAALKQHPAIEEAVAQVREDVPGEPRLVAYVVPRGEQLVVVGELRAFLQERLPDYLLPGRIVTLAQVPLNVHGKLDRQHLPVPGEERPAQGRSYVGPRTEREAELVRIWEQVLRLKQVGIEDNFFELGGDSIRSIQIVARAKAAGLLLEVQQLFRQQTIAELAQVAQRVEAHEEAQREERWKPSQPFGLLRPEDREKLPAGIEDAYPLSALQAGMIYHMELTRELPGSPDYHNVDSYYYRLPFDQVAFQQAVDCAVQRHAVLRTSFDLTSYSEPLQLVHTHARLLVEVEDIRHCTYTEQVRIIKQFVECERNNYFDMSRPPLLRFHIHRRTDDSFQFTITEFHPILDGWSIHSILAQIFKQYLALLENDDVPEEALLTTSFRDFIALEKSTLQSEACRQYWESVVGDYERLNLPTWFPSDVQREQPRYNKIEFPVPLEVSLELQHLAHSLNVSLKHVLLAVHVRVLSMLSGQTDIVTGVLTHGRPEIVDGERVAGLFLNVVPLRLHIPDGSWRDLIQHIFDTECTMLPFRRYPLAEMQRRWGGRTPLFNTAFSYFDFHVFNTMFSEGYIEDLEFRITSPNSGYVLDTLFFAPRRPGHPLTFELVYETARLGEHDAHRIGDYYVAAMRTIASYSQQHYAQACLLPLTETTRLLTEWNAPATTRSESTLVHQHFEAQAERTPDAVAVFFEGQYLTYRQLNERANQLAHYLQQYGVKPNVLVGFGLARSLEMVVGLLAILKAGGAYVPLDPTYPSERLTSLLEETKVAVLLTQQHLLARFPTQKVSVICLDRDWSEIAQQSTTNPSSDVRSQNLAYVIYTSGSTGVPKGVLTSHQALANYVRAASQVYEITSRDRVLQFASINFDASVEEIYPCLTQGATLILRPEAMLGSAQTFMQTCQQLGITCVSLPTAYWHELVAQMSAEIPSLPTCLRLVIIGGETASSQQLALWERFARRRVRLINTYGPTEATVIATWYEVESQMDLATSQLTIPIGRSLANTQIYLLDAYQQLVPIGVVGEICIGGPGLAQGYLHHPELTAQCFVPHPFSQEPGARLYRTGDLARYLPDGTLEFCGRSDRQVKIRGFRIEPAEIEAVLNQHSGVQAIVLAREDVPGDRRLVAYLVAQEKVAEGEWRAYLSKRLPQHMIPSFFVQLDEFPLTSNGKIDRRALPAPEQSWSGSKYVGPRTPLEEQIAQIWEEVLGLERAGVLDNFFDLGGHSLKATQIISRTQRALGVELPLRSLFEHPTIADLARAIEHILEQQKGENFTAFQPISSAIHPAQLVAYLEDLPAEDLQELLAATNPEFED